MCAAMISALTVKFEQISVTKAIGVPIDIFSDSSVELDGTISVMRSHVRVFIVIYRVTFKSTANIHGRRSHTFKNSTVHNFH